MIYYLKGNAVEPKEVEGRKIIVHVCNDVGAWGKGFVMALSNKWKKPEQEFRASKIKRLGYTQFIKVEDDTWVANMIAQHGIHRDNFDVPPVRYIAIETCLKEVGHWASKTGTSIVMPRIGCGLAGGRWSMIENIIEATLSDVDVYVYDFEDVTSENYVKPNI